MKIEAKPNVTLLNCRMSSKVQSPVIIGKLQSILRGGSVQKVKRKPKAVPFVLSI
jgi:hypothetical protein